MFESKFNSLTKYVKEESEKNFNETIQLIDSLAKSLFQFRKDYEEINRKELIQNVKTLKLLKLFYLKYYYDKEISLESKNINLLRFVNNISVEFLDLNISHNQKINTKISEMKTSIESYFRNSNNELNNVQNLHINLLFNEVQRNFKCENIL